MAQILDLGKIRFNWAGTYNAGTEYSYNDLVKYGPNLYAYNAVSAATGVAPTNTGSWILATEGVAYKGVYTSGTLYYKNDIVTDNTNTYITLTQHTASSAVATPNSNLEIIALGQSGLPNQTGNANKVLISDGAETEWAATTHLTKEYIGDAQGQDAADFETSAGLTNTLSVFSKSATDFVQFPIVNESEGAAASTDFIAYSAQGTNDSGWIDMGITSGNFSAETFGITGPHDGYVFMSAPRTTQFDVVATSISGGQATVTTGLPHGYSTGNVVRIEGVNATFNGAKSITLVPSPTTFRFATSAAPQTEVELDPFGTVYRPTGNGNLVFATDETGLDNKIVFAAGGFATGDEQMSITPNQNVHIEIPTSSTSATTGALTVVGGVGVTGSLNTAGNLGVQGTASTTGTVYGGTGAAAFGASADLTDPMAVYNIAGGADSFAQFAVRNSTASSSTDIIAYSSEGDDAAGWIDMGITGADYDVPAFGITGPHDGYIFMNAVEGTDGAGNLVIATGNNGTDNKIIFAAGGYGTGDTQMEITPDTNIHIEIPTPSTSATTGALTVVGGVGISGDMNIQGDVSVQGTITFGGAGTTVETENLSVTDPLIFTGAANAADIVDLGLVGEYKVGANTKYAGIVRDASDGIVKFFSDAATKPISTVNFSEAGLAYANIQANNATFGGTLSVTGTATVATPTSSGHATTKSYSDTSVVDSVKTAVGSGTDFAYDADNRLTAYKVSPSKRYSSITYNGDGFVSGYTEVLTVGGVTTTTAYTVTTNVDGNITAIAQV
jgi:hypothetical protein